MRILNSPRAPGNRQFQSNMPCLFMIWRGLCLFKGMLWVQRQYLKKAKNLNDMLLRLHAKKERHGLPSIQKYLWDHSAPSVLYMWLKRRGCFLRTFTRRPGFGWDKRAGCSACRMRGRKEGEKWRRGRAEWGFGKAFSSPSTLSIYRSSTHTPTHRHRRTAETKSGCDIIHGKRSQTTFSPFSVLVRAAERSWRLSVCPWLAEKERIQRSWRGQRSWICLPQGVWGWRGPAPESSLNFPGLATTFQTLRCRISARYSADSFFFFLPHSLISSLCFWVLRFVVLSCFFFFFSVCPVHDVCRSSVSGANSTTTMKVCRTERDQTCFSLRLLRHAARRKVIKIEVTLSHMLSLIYLQAIIVFSIKHLQKALSKANVCLKLPVSQSRAESNTMTMRASLGSPFVMDTFRAISWPRIHGPPVVSFEMRSGSLWKLVETKSTLLIYQMLLIQLLIHTSEQQKLRA